MAVGYKPEILSIRSFTQNTIGLKDRFAVIYLKLLHDQPWISPWIKSISNELSLFTWSRHNCLVMVTSSAIACDVISRTKTEQVRHGNDMLRSSFLSSSKDSLCNVKNKIMYVLSWRTVSEMVRHSSTNIILYSFRLSECLHIVTAAHCCAMCRMLQWSLPRNLDEYKLLNCDGMG